MRKVNLWRTGDSATRTHTHTPVMPFWLPLSWDSRKAMLGVCVRGMSVECLGGFQGWGSTAMGRGALMSGVRRLEFHHGWDQQRKAGWEVEDRLFRRKMGLVVSFQSSTLILEGRVSDPQWPSVPAVALGCQME